MKKFKLILLLSTCLSFINILRSQNDIFFTHFQFNPLAYNPAFAGLSADPTITAIYRDQWSGIEGRPQTFQVNCNVPILNRRSGIAFGITNDRLGLINDTYVDIMYAYQIRTSDHSSLSLGLGAKVQFGMVDWEKARPLEEDDQLINTTQPGLIRPNFGFGAFWRTPRFYLGFSAPMLMNTSLYRFTDVKAKGSKDQRSYFLMSGLQFPISKTLELNPGVNFSYNPSSPFDIDLNLNFIFNRIFLVGVSHRLGDSFDALVQYQINRQLRAGLAYDYSFTALNDFTNGSAEIMLIYQFGKGDQLRIDNIRFFE